MKLKLFVWTGFQPDWTGGLAFAIARTEEEAKKMIEKENFGIKITDWGTLEVRQLNHRVARFVSGGS